MKIGIITFHRANNYGAVLQCFALQEALKQVGYNVQIINYKQPFIESKDRIFSFAQITKIFSKPRKTIRYILETKHRIQVNTLFNHFRNKYLNCTTACTKNNIPQNFDCYIIGSDQLWNIECTKKIDTIFFGNFSHPKSSLICGYAISGNTKSLNQIPNEILKQYLRNFNHVSFREINLRDNVLQKTGINGRVDLDPTLLLSPNVWNKIINTNWENKKYILVYEVRRVKNKERNLDIAAVKLSQQLKCDIIHLSSYKYTPEDFVSLFKYATYIITSSFHGTVFSLIFNKPVSVVKLNDGHDNRYINLLESINATHLLCDIDNIIINNNIDYENINKDLKKLQEKSIAYINNLTV